MPGRTSVSENIGKLETQGRMQVLAFKTLCLIKKDNSNEKLFDDVVQIYHLSEGEIMEQLAFMHQVWEYIIKIYL
jgi:hypothetical protein